MFDCIEADEIVPAQYAGLSHADVFAMIADEWESVRMCDPNDTM